MVRSKRGYASGRLTGRPIRGQEGGPGPQSNTLSQCPFSAGYQNSYIYILTPLSSEPHPHPYNLLTVSLRPCAPHPRLPAHCCAFPHASWSLSAVSSSLMTVNSSVLPFSWIFSLFMSVTISCSLSWAWELDANAVAPFPSPPSLDVIIRV